jgi:hypothetical protein
VTVPRINIPGSGEVEADEVEFEPLQEFWNEYRLADGTTLRLRLVLAAVYRVPGAQDAEGNPVYVARSTNVMSIETPDTHRGES